MEISIVLPAYNEEEILERTVTMLRTGLTDLAMDGEILIVERDTDR